MRERAEKKVEKLKKEVNVPETSSELVHELQVHQAELQMQNEELRGAQEELAKLYHEYHELYNESPTGYFSLDKYGNIRNVNIKGTELLGLGKERIIGRSFIRFIQKEYRNDYFNALNLAINTTENQEVELQLNGYEVPFYVHMEIMPVFNKYDEKYRITIIDVSGRKKAEEELRKARDYLEEQVKERTLELEEAYNSSKESESKFKTLAESSPDIINRIDKEFKTVYINPAIIEISGKPPEHFIGKNIDKLGIPEEFTVPLKEKTMKTFNTREIQEFETEMPTVEGLKTFYTYLAPEFDEKREVITVFTVSHDITELKQAEKHLKESIQELERSNQELEQFAYVSSHDLQEPLRTIASFTQLLERRYKGQLDADADEFMDYIVEAAVRMKAQIEGLLEYSRVGTKGEKFKPVNMNKIVNQTIQSLNTSIKEVNANIKVDELPEVMGDENQLQRAFQNLISNAIKFKKQEEPLKIHIFANKNEKNKEYVFSVQDNGIGIEEQYLERIFTIFQRLHTRDVYEGTGIGLSVVKRIIERHGGRVWVESEFGVGSTFYFTIPIKSVETGGILKV